MRNVWLGLWAHLGREKERQVRAIPCLRHVFEALAAGDLKALHARGAAKLAHCGQRTLCRHAQAVLGEGLHTYLARFRLDQAEHLLTSSDEKVDAIGRVLGYATANGLARALHVGRGTCPSTYRRADSARTRRRSSRPPCPAPSR